MSTIGIYGLLVIAAVIVLIFGSRWLPSWGRSLGQGMRGFTKELTSSLKGDEEQEEEERVGPASPTPESTSTPAPPSDKQRVSS
jgi:TatA/E family protein of Tat protein translocase